MILSVYGLILILEDPGTVCTFPRTVKWCNFVTVARSGYFLRWGWDAFRAFMFTIFSFRSIFRQRGQGLSKVLMKLIKHNMYF